MAIGEIILVNDIELEVESLKQIYPNHRIFPKKDNSKDFKKGDSMDVINESYISSNTQKYLILVGDNFNIEAQNALLKVLEEPPNNINFIIVTKSKSAILPTILSRMIITNKRKILPKIDFPLDLKTLNLGSIRDFVNNADSVPYISKEKGQELIESLLFSVKKAGIKLSQNELEYFSQAIKQIYFNGITRYIILTLLLMLLENKRNMTSLNKTNISQR